MKLLLDFLPILLFFGAYKLYGIYVGTAVLMGATVVQMAIIYAIDKKLTTMHKATLACTRARPCQARSTPSYSARARTVGRRRP